jgi:hypothetical protein
MNRGARDRRRHRFTSPLAAEFAQAVAADGPGCRSGIGIGIRQSADDRRARIERTETEAHFGASHVLAGNGAGAWNRENDMLSPILHKTDTYLSRWPLTLVPMDWSQALLPVVWLGRAAVG